ncbi:MAG: hypothetical protein H0X42_06535 [Solirubrobacterales bacterium]|nr:hypothetical protein [Solirubrobacterales bacterium]
MLGPGRYLLGVAELALLVGFARLGATRVRSRLLPRFEGAPAHLATGVLSLAILIWAAEILGTVSLFKPVPYVLLVLVTGLSLRLFVSPGGGEGEGARTDALARPQDPPPRRSPPAATAASLAAVLIATVAVVHFAAGVRTRLLTDMTGFDSTWYHGPFAAGFYQSGNTIDLHFIAPQFLAWFYPANGEIFHAVGMLAFGRDLLSPLLNLGWFAGCLLASWCIGRPYRVAPWSLILGAIALSVPALSDQAGEARNDIVGIFFLLAAVAIALNAWAARSEAQRGLPSRALLLTGLAAGLAAGTKLNFLLPAAVLVLGLVAIAPRGARLRALAAVGPAAVAGGGYWYLRNLVHTGNPLPWVHHLGPISLPAPGQTLGGREAHSVLGYLTNGSVWSDWFLPGLHHGLWIVWPLLGTAALAGLALCLVGWKRSPVLTLAGLVGLAAALAWLVAPTSASGPDEMPRGFESALRYLVPAVVLGVALLPATPLLRRRLASVSASRSHFLSLSGMNYDVDRGSAAGRGRAPQVGLALVGTLTALLVVAGYPIQRHYLENRYANPSFTTPGLNAAFAWARDVSGARIATTSTRQYPLFGTDLSNHVQFIGVERPHGGFEAPTTCRAWRTELNKGQYDYVVTTRDRLEAGQPPYPEQTRWTEGPGARVVLKVAPTVVFKLTASLDPSKCPSG